MKKQHLRTRMTLPVWLVLAFSFVSSVVLGVHSLQSEQELQRQVLLQSRQRSVHLADAMAGQVGSVLSTMHLTLRELRRAWQVAPERFPEYSGAALRALPGGWAQHVTVVNAQGRVAFNSSGPNQGYFLGDREWFGELSSGGDRMVVSGPVFGRLTGQWVFVVAAPLLEHGRFAGVIQLVVPTSRVAASLAELQLSEHDTVSLVHDTGAYLARSQDNDAAMIARAPMEWPLFHSPEVSSGTFRDEGARAGDAGTVGWHRVHGRPAAVLVRLADRSVFVPLEPALERGRWVTRVLMILTVLGGLVIAWLVSRVDRGLRQVSESERELEEAQRLANVGNWMHDTSERHVDCSDEMLRIFGAPLGATRLSLDEVVARIHPDDIERVEAQFSTLVNTRQRIQLELRLLCVTGEMRHLRVIAVAEPSGGEALRLRGTVQDVTEIRTAQESLERLNADLEARVQSRTRELELAKREMDTFAYSVSHDLRSPLRGIQGFASLLHEEADRLSQDGRACVQRIQDSARFMAALIADLLSLAQHSRAQIQFQRVDLSEQARGVLAELRQNEPQRSVDCAVEEGLEAWADPLLTRAVLQNLLGNAWKYTGRTEHPAISLARSPDTEGFVQFCVKDNGAGFSMAHAAQLFQPFKRLHPQSQFEGTGIGLATVQRIIERHGGSVRAEAEVGAGASFWFTLPRVPEQPVSSDGSGGARSAP